jgi:uncharacterized surface protein with fasciclin (FAS1) repeats
MARAGTWCEATAATQMRLQPSTITDREPVRAGAIVRKEIIMADTVQDIVETAVAAGSFTTLVAAVSAAGLIDTLKGAGPFTVFAPSDDAFAALPAGTVDTLVKPENKDKLTAILLLHVLPGKVMAADVAGQVLDPVTAGGATIHVDGTDGVTVDGAKVVTADIACSNGVIHVIDAVLLPKN